MKHLYFTWGKFQPPHRGHMKIIGQMKEYAGNVSDEITFVSPPKNHPLNENEKLHLLRECFGPNVLCFPKFSDVVHYISDSGYTYATMIVGEDRVVDFRRMLAVFEKELANPVSFQVISGGARNDSDGLEGLSSTKMREYVKENRFDLFLQSVPLTMSEQNAVTLFSKLVNNINRSK